MQESDLITIGIFLAAFTLVIILNLIIKNSSKELERRINRLKERQLNLASPSVPNAAASSVRKENKDSSIAIFDNIIKALPSIAKLRERLERTGKKISVGKYFFICFFIIGFVSSILIFLVKTKTIIAIFLAIGIGVGLPHLYIGRLASKRLKNFLSLFPDAIDLIVRGLRSGLPVPESINIVATEIGEPVSSIFREIANAVKLGIPLEKAMLDMALKLKISEYDFFVISITLQRETGGNLAEILSNLSDTIRTRHMMKLKIKAISSEARMSAMIISALPILVSIALYFLSPEYITILFTDFKGNLALFGAACSMGLGVFSMLKMAKFEI